jgi:hypothetical protein
VKNRPRVAKERERILRKHFVPVLGKKNLDAVDDRDIGGIIDGLKDVPSAANHAFKEARTFFRWASKPPRRYVKFSPLTGMEMPFKEKKRKRSLADGELGELLDTVPLDSFVFQFPNWWIT